MGDNHEGFSFDVTFKASYQATKKLKVMTGIQYAILLRLLILGQVHR